PSAAMNHADAGLTTRFLEAPNSLSFSARTVNLLETIVMHLNLCTANIETPHQKRNMVKGSLPVCRPCFAARQVIGDYTGDCYEAKGLHLMIIQSGCLKI
ncbi:MAG: hypothetical protein O9272_02145, partial [Brevundimonas sp.]|nr:hypothetical protein [Brevundimonas sp.]